MKRQKNLEYERKRKVNLWIVKGRLVYISGIILASVFGKTTNWYEVNLPFLPIILTAIFYGLLNLLTGQFFKRNYLKTEKGINILGGSLLALDLMILTLIMNLLGGIEGVGFIFFILPMLSASLLFGFRGSLVAAIYSGLLLNLLVILEKFGFIPHYKTYSFLTSDYKIFEMALTKTVSISVFYVLFSFLAGFGSKFIFDREKKLSIANKKLDLKVKELEAAKQRLKRSDKIKSEFVSLAAHQLRTPLAAVKWIFETILDGDEGRISRSQKEILERGFENNERMINLVDDLLNVSRIEQGNLGFSFARVNLAPIIENSIGGLRRVIEKNQISLTKKISNKLPETWADPEKIGLVVENLIDNAIKYSPPGSVVQLSVSFDAKKKTIEFEIKDSGIGILPEERKKVFSRFFRGSNASKISTEGTGFGLFISKKIVERHGGKIGFNCPSEGGTIFNFSLPVNESMPIGKIKK